MNDATSPDVFARALQERRKRAARRRLIALLASIAAVVLLGVGVYLLYFSSVFVTRDVEVTGTNYLTVEQVLAQAQVPKEEPLALLDVSGISSRIAELPEVAVVTVGRRFPGTVLIEITERQLVFQRVVGAKFQWVDGTGTVFRTADAAVADAPLAAVDGDDPRLLRDVATVVGHLPDAVRPDVKQIRARGVDDITVELADGRRIVWGSAEDSQVKGEVLAVLLGTEAKVYDVSAPANPTTK